MADLEQVRRYFGALYLPGQTFELVAVKNGQARRRKFGFPNDLETVLDAIAVFEAAEWNLYASVLPLEVQASEEYDRIWMDRDDPFGPWPFGADPNWDSAAWPEPQVLVRTSEESPNGQRWQAIWKIEPVSVQEGRSLIKRIAKAGGGDPSVHDPRRVLRIPGVRNAKRGSITRLLATHNGITNPEAFMLPDDIESGGPVSLEALMNADISAPHHVLGEWLQGSDQGDRARKAFVTARFLKSCKVGFEDALAIVNTGAKRATPPLSDDEVVHAVRSAYNRQD